MNLLMKKAVLAFALALASGAAAQQPASPKPRVELYESVKIDAAGLLEILTTDGRTIRPRKSRDQTKFSDPLISPDKKTVGWLVDYPNPCCTSYPIPLGLVMYSGGKQRGVPVKMLEMVSGWRVLSGGDQVGLRQETVHGGLGVHYELYDVRMGKLIAQYDPKTNENGQEADEDSDRPDWVKAVDEAR